MKFIPASEKPQYTKIAVFGAHKVGKTMCALSAAKLGRLALIDCEQGSHPYADLIKFDSATATTIAEVMALLADIKADGGRTYQWLGIDSVSILWQSLQPSGDVSKQQWGAIKRIWNSMLVALLALPVNIILTAREHVGDDKVIRPDAEKDLGYFPDITLQMRVDHSAVVRSVRSTTLAVGTVIKPATVAGILAALASKQVAATA